MKTTFIAALMTCCILAWPDAGRAQDSSTNAPVGPERKATLPKDILKVLVGSWEGTCRTWFLPGQSADESQVKGEIRPFLNGRFIRHTYEGTLQGKPRHGEETLVFNGWAKRFQVSWMDDFHMRAGILFSEGEADGRGITVKGKYEVPDSPPWGWKTVYEIVDDDHLTITAYNIKPDGQETKAIETAYRRVKR